MTPEKLLKYELPSWVEHCSIGWIQTVVGYYYGKKTMRKWYRYQKRLAREKWIQGKIE
jgi:hypothetical protein